jgi:acid phosphatase type 7
MPNPLYARRPVRLALLACLCALTVATAEAHVDEHPSVHDTVNGVLTRLKREMPMDALRALTRESAVAFLTTDERNVLGSEHLSFTTSAPATVYVIHDVGLGDDPFWLEGRDFTETGLEVSIDGDRFDVWQKDFDAGFVGLGVNSLQGGYEHYVVAVTASGGGAAPDLSNMYPGYNTLATAATGVKAFADRDDTIDALPDALTGATLIQTSRDDRGDGQILNVMHFTDYPGTHFPDQVTLTWSEDPKTTVTVQWRTSLDVTRGVVQYATSRSHNSFTPGGASTVVATTELLETPETVNDPFCNRHTAVLRGLDPGTAYVYSVGDGTAVATTELAEFTTAPDGVEPFSFVYMGDAQNGLDRWGTLVHNAFRARPDAAFYVMAGDLVNRGNDRDDWDSFFHNADGIFNRRPLVPAIGNHENQGGHPALYLEEFTLPDNGPDTIESERAYSFTYSNALFVILDSNLDPADQTEWLDAQLAASDATWKFMVYHHPAYSSKPNRDNKSLRELWGSIFDKYHVDMALQGHDHAYLRTHPMKDGEAVATPAEGTVYIVSVSGTKMYDQDDPDYEAYGMTNVATYQVLDIRISGNQMVYRAYDIDGALRDELVIQK